MKILKRILIGLVGLLILIALYIQFGFNKVYDAPYPDVQITTDSATLAHAEYLIYGPAHCVSCHSTPGQEGDLKLDKKIPLSGGREFKLPFGTITVKNLTPDKATGIGGLTNGEIARTLRYGVDHDGHSILPFMPFSNMSDDDVSAIISYLRLQDPVYNPVPESQYNFMGKALKRFVMTPPQPNSASIERVPPDSSVAYGEYLAYSVAGCLGCHTPFNMQKMEFEKPHFQGGGVMEEETHIFTSPNLTPDPTTGHIYSWSEDAFVSRFKGGPVYEDSPMPWEAFSKMNERDLKAIYRFLKSLEPVEHQIDAIVVAKTDQKELATE